MERRKDGDPQVEAAGRRLGPMATSCALLALIATVSCLPGASAQTQTPNSPHQCYYYRVREGGLQDVTKFQIRNCSAGVNHCVKLTTHHEMAGLDKDVAETRAVEGRCAYSAYECPEETDRCRDEKPRKMWGMVRHERLCCYTGSLTNSPATTALPSTSIVILSTLLALVYALQ